MPLPSLHVLARHVVVALATAASVNAAPTAASPYEGLVPREFTLADGTRSIIYENRAVRFVASRQDEASAPLDKRLSYHTYTPPNGRNDFCGEANPSLSSGPGAPLAADCMAIADAYTNSAGSAAVTGYWIATPSDFSSAPGGYVTLAAHETCKFPIRLISEPLQDVYFGANDLRFYIRSATQGSREGRIEAQGAVSCNNNTSGFFNSVQYRLTHT